MFAMCWRHCTILESECAVNLLVTMYICIVLYCEYVIYLWIVALGLCYYVNMLVTYMWQIVLVLCLTAGMFVIYLCQVMKVLRWTVIPKQVISLAVTEAAGNIWSDSWVNQDDKAQGNKTIQPTSMYVILTLLVFGTSMANLNFEHMFFTMVILNVSFKGYCL